MFTAKIMLPRVVTRMFHKANLRLSCSICWMELERVRPCGAGGPVGRCHVVVLLTWSTKKILPWLSIRASQSDGWFIIDTQKLKKQPTKDEQSSTTGNASGEPRRPPRPPAQPSVICSSTTFDILDVGELRLQMRLFLHINRHLGGSLARDTNIEPPLVSKRIFSWTFRCWIHITCLFVQKLEWQRCFEPLEVCWGILQ